jgi:endonuclease/exonuclease/phosphatase family metal-dependent hydrolase
LRIKTAAERYHPRRILTENTNMGGSCCGGRGKGTGSGQHDHGQPGRSCCSHTHEKTGGGVGTGLILVIALVALLGVGVLSALALGQPVAPKAPDAPKMPVAPAPPAAPKTPGTPADPTVKKHYDPETDGVIRHGRAEPIAKPAGAIRIATYNIENFFEKESVSDETGSSTPAKPVAHRKALADAIHKINADVLAVEEVESKETLTRFRDEYLADMGYTYIASIDAGDPRGIEQSILSKYPIKDEKNWPNIPLAGVHPDKLGTKRNPDAGKPLILKRSPMRATVVVPADPSQKDAKPTEVTLFAVHHKSGPYYGYLREAEGTKVVELVHEFEKDHPGAAVIVLGDFNARTTEKSYQVYITGGMIDAMTGVPGGVESKEFLSHSSGRTIDHILLNAPAAAMVALDTRFVLGTPQRPEGVNWRNTDPPVGYGSDHYPVIADLIARETTGATVKRGIVIPKPVPPGVPASPALAPATDGK